MSDSSTPAGLVFSETMSGPFALGATDPALGAAAGRRARTPLSMHVTITIADVAAFAHDGSHAARLDGVVRCAPLAHPLRGEHGVMRLFAPNAAGTSRVMYYGLPVTHRGRARYLAGVKHVDGRSLFRMWRETTTLYTRLHDGADESAPVIGAGILRLGPLDLLRTLPTMRPTPAAGAMRGAATLARFGEFFAGQLWDSYVVHRPVTTTLPPTPTPRADARHV
jgi:hypothetical protein